MTIEFLTYDVTPASPMFYYQKNFEDIENIFPLDADFIDRVWAASIDWSDGTIVPIANLPIDDIREALIDDSSLLVTIGFNNGLIANYRDDSTVYILPGGAALRGVSKIQGFDTVTSKTRVVDVGASLQDPVADHTTPGTPSGLDPNTRYYGYIKLDVASSYPEYRWSKQPPTYASGMGPQFSGNNNLRFFGSLKTGPMPNAAILPHHRYADGRLIFRDVIVGPSEPTTNLLTRDTAGWVSIDLTDTARDEDAVPPTADIVFLSAQADSHINNARTGVRAVGDIATDSGYFFFPKRNLSGDDDRMCSTAWLEIPVNTIDGLTDEPRTAAVEVSVFGFESDPPDETDTTLVVVGFRERL